MYTSFWYNDPNVLYDKTYLFEIFPMKEYDTVRKLNAVIRFSIYYSMVTCNDLSIRRTHDYQGKTRKSENIGTVIMSTKFEQLK